MKPQPVSCAGLVLISLFAMAPVFWGIYRPVGDDLDISGYLLGRDFINIWVAPQIAFNADWRTLFDWQAYHEAIGPFFGQPLPFHNWSAPPFMLLLYWPFSQIPYFASLAIWTCLTLGAYLLAANVMLDGSRRLQGLVLLALSPASLFNLIEGQNGYLTAALFLGGFLALERRPRAAGVMFGMLTLKPHLGLIIPIVLLRARAWRVILTAATVFTLLIAMSVAAFGVEPWILFFTKTRAYQTQLLLTFEGYYVYMMSSVFAAVRNHGLGVHWAWLLQIAVAIPVIAAAWLVWSRTEDRLLRVQLVVSAATLITPYLFLYDLTALSAVAVWRLLTPRGLTPGDRLLYTMALLSPCLMHSASTFDFSIAPIITGAVFIATLRDIRISAGQGAVG